MVVPKDLSFFAELRHEVLNFEASQSARTGHLTFSHREGEHDASIMQYCL